MEGFDSILNSFNYFPNFIVFVLLMATILNYDYLKFIYFLFTSLICVFFALIFNYLIPNNIKKETSTPDPSAQSDKQETSSSSSYTNLFEGGNLVQIKYALTWFVFCYILFPMFTYGSINVYLIIFLSIGTLGFTLKLPSSDVSYVNSLMQFIFCGVLLGCLFSYSAMQIEPPLAFFGPINTNNVVCQKPMNQTFKCDVYKGGKLVSSI